MGGKVGELHPCQGHVTFFQQNRLLAAPLAPPPPPALLEHARAGPPGSHTLGIRSATGDTAGKRLPPGNVDHPHPTWTQQTTGGPGPAHSHPRAPESSGFTSPPPACFVPAVKGRTGPRSCRLKTSQSPHPRPRSCSLGSEDPGVCSPAGVSCWQPPALSLPSGNSQPAPLHPTPRRHLKALLGRILLVLDLSKPLPPLLPEESSALSHECVPPLHIAFGHVCHQVQDQKPPAAVTGAQICFKRLLALLC